MAIVDKYGNAKITAGQLAKAASSSGARPIVIVGTVEVAAADDNGSVYRVFSSVPENLIPVQIDIVCDAVTDGTDYDLGLYQVGGAVIDKDCLMDGQTLATALTRATGQGLGLSAVGAENVVSTLGDLSAQTKPDMSYDIALTANVVGTAAGTVSVVATFVQA